ncbi:MAG TPA: type II secretion system protein GspM [Baekduia sp.]
MTVRDRSVLIIVGFLAVVAAFWLLALSPKRKDAADISTQLQTAQQRLTTAQATAAGAESARASYDSDYATVARLGKAVPVDDDVPSLVYQLEHTAHTSKIDFRSISVTGGGTAAAPAPTGAAAAVASANGTTTTAPAATSALPPGAVVGTAGFPTMPFTFNFDGKFFPMQHFLHSLDGLTTVNGKSINVKGRLLTVDGVSLVAGPKGFPDVTATVAATAYLLPSDEGLAPGAPADTSAAPSTATSAGTTPTASLIGSN